jgi:hypothetical protein
MWLLSSHHGWCYLLLYVTCLKPVHVSCQNLHQHVVNHHVPTAAVNLINESYVTTSNWNDLSGGYIPPFNVTQNKPRVFLRRMRKAGSSTVSEYIMAASNAYARALSRNVDDVIIYDRMEYAGFNIKCIFGPNPILTLPKTVLITHFRNPLSRINSEYW